MKNTDNSQLRRLQTLGQAFNKNRIVSPEEMEAILEAIVGALATFKKENQDLNNDTKNIVENYFEIAEKEYNKILDLFENKHYKVSSEINEKINLVKNLIEEFKAIKPKDGQNGKDGVAPTIEEIVPKVLKQIKIPEPEKFELNSEELINKINEAEGENKIDASKIKNLPIPKSIGGRGIVEAPKDGKTYGRKNRDWVEVGNGNDHNHDSLYYQKSEVDTKIADLVDSSPATLNTLNELASALGDDPNFATTIATQIGNKEDTVNKTTAIAGNETSNVKFPTVKAIYDWATGLFATISSLNTTNANVASNTTAIATNTTNITSNTSAITSLISIVNTNDSNAVHKSGTENIGGDKTPTGSWIFKNGLKVEGELVLNENRILKTIVKSNLNSNISSDGTGNEQELTEMKITLPIYANGTYTIKINKTGYCNTGGGNNNFRTRLGASTSFSSNAEYNNVYSGGAAVFPTFSGQCLITNINLSTQKYINFTMQNDASPFSWFFSASGFRTSAIVEIYRE